MTDETHKPDCRTLSLFNYPDKECDCAVGVHLIHDIESFIPLREEWDGENAAAPNRQSIDDAISFVRDCANADRQPLEPTLHVNGNVILEIDSGLLGVLGSFQFPGNGTVIYVLGSASGVADLQEILARMRYYRDHDYE